MTRAIRIRWLAAGLLAAVAFQADAQTVGVAVEPRPADGRAVAGVATDDARIDRHCLRHTGSRITSARRHKGCAPVAGRVWTREDLERTGHLDIASALRTLDPSVY